MTSSSSASRVWTLPNLICWGRLIGAFSLFYLAFTENASWFVAVFVVLSLSDWIDGRLARWLDQRSDFGARLDSFADATLYTGLFWGTLWLKWDLMRQESLWWGTGIASYVLTTLSGLIKYGRVPSYHSYGAKLSQWLILVGAVCLLLGYSVWPFRIAMLGLVLTNLEATAITWYLPQWRADVLSFVHARRLTNISSNEES